MHFWILFLEGPFARLCLGSGLTEGPLLLVAKVALDQTLFAVTINLAYAFIDGILSDQSPSDAWRRSRQVLVPSVVQSWRFWPLVHLISYSPLMPVWKSTSVHHVGVEVDATIQRTRRKI